MPPSSFEASTARVDIVCDGCGSERVTVEGETFSELMVKVTLLGWTRNEWDHDLGPICSKERDAKQGKKLVIA
jgi:hypothetical protein